MKRVPGSSGYAGPVVNRHDKPSTHAILQNSQIQLPIRTPRIAAAVAAFQNLVKAVDDLDFFESTGFLELLEQSIAFGVDVGGDVVRDLAGGVAEADFLIERDRTRLAACGLAFVAAPGVGGRCLPNGVAGVRVGRNVGALADFHLMERKSVGTVAAAESPSCALYGNPRIRRSNARIFPPPCCPSSNR